MRDRLTVLAVTGLAAVALVLVAILVALGKDPSAFMTAVGLLVTPVFAALLYGEVREVKAQTNGTTSAIVSLLSQQIGQVPPTLTAENPAVSDNPKDEPKPP